MFCDSCKRPVTNQNSETKCCGTVLCGNCGTSIYFCLHCTKPVERFPHDNIYSSNTFFQYFYFKGMNYLEKRYGLNFLETAIERQNLPAVQYFSKVCDKQKHIGDMAIEKGNTEIIRCLDNEGFYFKSRTPLQLLDDYPFVDENQAGVIGNILSNKIVF